MNLILAEPTAEPLKMITTAPSTDAAASPVPRILGQVAGPPEPSEQAGTFPTLICIGGVHGNEPSGIRAIERVLSQLVEHPERLRGRVFGLSGNRQALAQKRRYIDSDLNRHWIRERVDRLRQAASPLVGEDEELAALDRELQTILAAKKGPVYCLDLHSTSGQGPAFVSLDDSLANRKFALGFNVPLVMGLEEELEGTLTSYLISQGAVAIGFEAGQHDDPESVDRAAAAIWIALECAGVLPTGQSEVAAARAILGNNSVGLPRVVELRYRHPILPGDRFKMKPGFVNFAPIDAGQIVASDRNGPVFVQEAGRMLMPLYQVQGNDGFFLIRRIRPIWLKISALTRRLHLEHYVHWLPGVKRFVEEPGSFVVDRRWAHWWALEVFHLLGFARRGGRHDRFLRMTRRRLEP